jgi:CheY-like chemotaxis protein
MASILVVEDEELMRDTLLKILRMEQHEVVGAADGSQALRMTRDQVFDLVVTDIVMPEKEGIETIMELRRIQPPPKIIAMSSGGRGNYSTYLDLADKLGAQATLSKPFTASLFLEVVARVLGTSGPTPGG